MMSMATPGENTTITLTAYNITNNTELSGGNITNISIGIMAFVVAIGLYLIFFGEEERIITKIKTIRPQVEAAKVTKENYRKVMDGMNSDEKKVLSRIIDAQGTIFQSELVSGTGFAKAKVTRILDRLEGKGLVERKRRGMTNVVILKRQ